MERKWISGYGAMLLAIGSVGCASAGGRGEERSSARPSPYVVPECPGAATAVVTNNSDGPVYLYRRNASLRFDPVGEGQYLGRADPGTTRLPVVLPAGTAVATTRPVARHRNLRGTYRMSLRAVNVRWECRSTGQQQGSTY